MKIAEISRAECEPSIIGIHYAHRWPSISYAYGLFEADEFRGVANRAQAMRNKYGDDFYLAPRSRKHRYIFITGSRSYKRVVMRDLKYKIEDYQK